MERKVAIARECTRAQCVREFTEDREYKVRRRAGDRLCAQAGACAQRVTSACIEAGQFRPKRWDGLEGKQASGDAGSWRGRRDVARTARAEGEALRGTARARRLANAR